jgi:small-conductance mechanosensitive channel
VDDKTGTVERIGMKTTRLRALGGEQIIFSNADLLKSRILNFKRQMERRVQFDIGVTYETESTKLQKIPAMLKEAISRHPAVRFERAHLAKLGDFAVVYQAVFSILSADYTLYMDVQQAIYLELFERFEKEGIELAYPTQTLLLKPAPGEPCQAR